MKVSIVVIFDKFREEKLTRLLASIKPQIQNNNCEVILVQESNVSVTLPKLPIKVRHIAIPEKQGIPFNRNQGIKHAQGDVIVFIDDDCWVQEKWLSSLLQPLEQNQELLAVTSGTKIPRANFLGNCISALGFPGGGSLGFEKMWKVSPEGFTNHIAAGNCALRREVFNKVGFFDESLKYGTEDAEFSYRLEKKNISIKYVPEAHAFHEARTSLGSFVRWQLRRGRANYHFKKKVIKVSGFVKLRAWSTKNVLKENLFSWRFPIVFSLLGISFIIQQWGYYKEKWKHESKKG